MTREARTLRFLIPLALVTLCALAPAPAAARERTVSEWIERLRSGDAAARVEALEELAILGELARPHLEEALRDRDPDVRFHALYLLRAPEGALERSLRRITFGRADQPGATYKVSLQAYRRLIRRATPGLRSQLLRVSLRVAPQGRPRLVIVALSIWTELARGAEVSPGEAQLLAELLALDLEHASADLYEAFSALPPAKRLAALRGALTSSDTKVLARAARALGETTEPSQVVEARRLLLPLLRHAEPKVRHQAIYALGVLGPGDEQTSLGVVRAVRDVSENVIRVSLRLIGEWRIKLGRAAVEQVALDLKRSARTRSEAIRSLGLLGDPAAGETLRKLAAREGELGALAFWSLACLKAPGLDKDLALRIRSQRSAEGALYFRALARLGRDGRAALRACVLPKGPMPTGGALEDFETRRNLALDAYAYLRDARAADDLEELIRKPVRSRRPGERASRERAAEALAARSDARARRKVAELLIRPSQVDAETELLKGIFRHGAPDDLRDDLSRALRQITLRRGDLLAARAWVRVDPVEARRTLTRLIRGRVATRQFHDLTHALARAGEVELLTSDALPFARRELARAETPRDRLVWLTQAGIDHLYAGKAAEASLAFRRTHWTQPHWWHGTPAYNLACVAAGAGEPTAALRRLRWAVRKGYRESEQIRYDLDFLSLRKDPRFLRLVKVLELAEETKIPPPKLPLP
jgi:HEAT repeat protein